MNKTGLIIGREYFTRVKKKSFLITTILVPLIIVGFYAVIIGITVSGSSDKQSIAIIDEGGLFGDTVVSKNKNREFAFIKNESEQSFI
ncbi:MAG TPA: hypothetical protein VK498_12150, partial [Ferruginibacter sp.]|nr:hypothetical protein [Ferruginibacter sp.]